jgi:hypothetical protein
VKCWTSQYSKAISAPTANTYKLASSHLEQQQQQQQEKDGSNNRVQAEQSSNKTFSLLHIFKGHTKAVTSIKLHPISGLNNLPYIIIIYIIIAII